MYTEQDILDFIQDDKLVIHNAIFDIKFLNMELKKIGRPTISMDRAIDTLTMARRKYPGSPAKLDALCKRFSVDATKRTLHGALLDSELLAEVYLAMILDKELKFSQVTEKKEKKVDLQNVSRETLQPRQFEIPQEELKAHEEFISQIKDNLWNK